MEKSYYYANTAVETTQITGSTPRHNSSTNPYHCSRSSSEQNAGPIAPIML
jgi:hypothetical protein